MSALGVTGCRIENSIAVAATRSLIIELMFDTGIVVRQRRRRVPHPAAPHPRPPGVSVTRDQEDDPVGQKTVRFSDLSGQLITDGEAPARIVVSGHPGLPDGPVEIEALMTEAMDIEKAGAQVALVDLYFPGDDQPRRVVLDVAEFDKLATDKPMDEILATARPARRASRSAAAAASREDRVNYGTLQHAGKPHKGKTTDAEKRLVREHLDEINERLAAEDLRTISLTDPEHVERYGLEDLAADRGALDQEPAPASEAA
jgi:hypothetical protein